MKVVFKFSMVTLLVILLLNPAWAQYESGGSGSQGGTSGPQGGTTGSEDMSGSRSGTGIESGTTGSQQGTTGTQSGTTGSQQGTTGTQQRQGMSGQRSQSQMGQISGTSQILSTNELMNSDVKGSDGETIGTAQEFIDDNTQGSVKYVIISADELHPVPWSAIQVSQASQSDTGQRSGESSSPGATGGTGTSGRGGMGSMWGGQKKHTLSMNITKDQLKNAPTIDSVDVEELSDSSLQQKVDSFYSQYSTGQTGTQAMGDISRQRGMTTSANLFKASDTIGLDVKNMQDESIGKIKDLAIDGQKGNFAFGLVSYGGVLGVGESVAAVPWTSISVDTQNQTASLDASKDKLDSVALEGGDINKLSDRQFTSRVYEVFGAQPYGGIYGYEPEDSNRKDMNQPGKNKDKSNE
ncbi:MAG: PRC-barrel domain protein [Planctomycetes bacterium ADurb.Bin401]|nr:MAG: PRC-barrel domain protein [Planctomycetes bacterium ADurb.Bin401]